MRDLEKRIARAVTHFWITRQQQSEKQGKKTGERDRGGRSAVTGGGHLGGFIELVRGGLMDSGIADATIYHERNVILPGYFRPTKEWDLMIVVDGHLLATLEFKSQVGSFGNNLNNRAEEAVGNATDLWTAYREGAFKPSMKPWLGYFILLEEAPGSTRPVAVQEPHFKVFEEFRGASYAKRYELLCKRLVRERLYDAAALLLSNRVDGRKGSYQEPCEELTFRNLMTSLTASALAYAKSRDDSKGGRKKQ